MSTRLISLNPAIDAAPGESAIGRVQIFNESSTEARYTVTVVGLDSTDVDEFVRPANTTVTVPGNSSAICEIPVYVPRALGVGQHAAAFEVSSDRLDDRSVLAPFTLAIASVARVDLVAIPDTIRAKRKATFHLDITNNETETVDVSIAGEAPEVRVLFTPSVFSLRPGERAVAKGKVKGPRHLTGGTTQHNILISARGHAATTSVTAAYVQRPMFARRLRTVLGAVAVIAVWVVAVVGVGIWLANRNNDSTATSAELVGVDTDGDGIIDAYFDADGNPVAATDTDGDGIPDSFVDADGNRIPGTDTDGDGIPDTFVDAAGNPIEAIDTDGDGIPDSLSNGSADAAGTGDSADSTATGPAPTVLRGTVNAKGDVSDVLITLSPLELGEQPSPDATPIGFSGGKSAPSAKIWSARFGRIDTLGPVRQTEPLPSPVIRPDADGIWVFPDVAVRQSWKVQFVKPGFNTQSFVISPPADGSPIELDVELEPARGALSGIVNGPSGPLGGVEIIVTDGGLTFTTTSATDGAVGTWSLEGISTPAVYTISGTKRGFGTEVLQIELGASDQRSDADLRMQLGVAAIGGRVVDETGRAVGGATVTATNGEITRTTSTLTEGDIGSYSLPQLDIGPTSTYTVTVELDGFTTQTRRIPLSGNITADDFIMSGTTRSLTGMVTSAGGGGIVNAGVIISTGDLQFRTSTAAAPNAGSFSVDDLPPGNYTVTIEHFKHVTSTRMITLESGRRQAPLDIVLDVSAGPEALGTGSLVVTAIDSDPLADPPGIAGATVTLVRTRTGEIERVVTDPTSANVRIDDVPIGTYTLLISAPGYNDSPAQLVSIGLAEERRTVRLQELGQAAGKFVDSITGETLTGYTISIYEERSSGDRFIARIPDDNGVWQTEPDALGTGTYRIEVEDGDAPVGYVIRPDQILDPEVGEPMRFMVPVVKTSEQIMVSDIEGDAYPAISGQVFKPALDGVKTELVPIDDSTLAVALACNGSTPVPTQPFGSGEFSFAKEVVAGLIPLPADLGGSCEITVDAADYDPISMTLENIGANNGRESSDRRVNSALVAPAARLDGSVFWYDGRNRGTTDRIALEDVAIEAANVITGFVPAEATPTSPNPLPGITLGTLATTSENAQDGTAGAWNLDGQLFGASTYVFTAPEFGPGIIDVTIDEQGARTVTAGAGALLDTNGPGFAVELASPNLVTLQGQITILTNGTPKYGDVKISATGPFGDTLTNKPPPNDPPPNDPDFPDAVGPNGEFTISGVDAGTWNVSFERLPNHQFFDAASSASARVGPNEPPFSFDTTLVELGTLEVRVFDNATNDVLQDASITLRDFPNVGPAVGPPVGPNGNEIYTLDEIPVDGTDPVGTPAQRTFEITVPNYDADSAVITSPQTIVSQNGSAEVTMDISAGDVLRLDIGLDSLGSVTGRVENAGGIELPLVDDAPVPGKTTVTPTRVNPDGSDLTAGDPGFGAEPAEVKVGDGNNTFEVTGLPGFYELTVTNTQYEATPLVVPTDPLNTASVGTGVFEIRNAGQNDIGTYTLGITPGTLNIRAVDTLDNDVAGAVYDLYPNDATCAGTPPTAISGSIITGGVDVSLDPGQYCLKINKYDTQGAPIAFPSITTLTIDPAVQNVASELSVVAPLPEKAISVSGRITAVNQDDVRVELPDLTTTAGFTITTAYQGNTFIEVGPDTVPNLEFDDPFQPASISLTTPADLSYRYLLANLPAGEHWITAPEIPGYEPTGSKTIKVDIDGFGPVNDNLSDTRFDFEYKVGNADVTVVLDDGVNGDYPEATAIKLESPSGVTYAFTFDGPNDPADTITFLNVSPEAGDWKFSFTDALHQPVTDAIVTVPLALVNGDRLIQSGNEPAGEFAMTPRLARLSGTVQQKTATGNLDLAATGTMTLTNVSTQATTSLSGEARGTYEFDVTPGMYLLRIENDGYITTTTAQIDLTNAAGRITPLNVEIDKYVTVTVNISNFDDLTNPKILLVQGSSEIPADAGSNNKFSTIVAGTYRVRVTATNYPTTDFGNKTYGVGAEPIEAITLDRLASVSVSGPPTASVQLLDANGTLLASISNASTSSPFAFNSTATAGMTGNLSARVSATGFRTKIVDLGDTINAVESVTLLPDVSVSGKVTSNQGATVAMGSTIKATNTVTNAVVSTSTTDGDGNFSGLVLPALEDGSIENWTISFDVVGIGSGSTTVAVSNISPNTPTADISAAAQNLTVTFVVTDSGNGPLGGATVAIAGQSKSTVSTGPPGDRGKAAFSILETADLSWQVTSPDQIGRRGTLTLPGPPTTSRALSDVPVQMADRVDITGIVRTGATITEDATVRICADGTTTICGTSLYPPDELSAATTGTFTFGEAIAPGRYEIFATKTTGTGHNLVTVTGSIGLEVNWDNTFTLSPSSTIVMS